jgi:hypothetical protein
MSRISRLHPIHGERTDVLMLASSMDGSAIDCSTGTVGEGVARLI